MGGIYITVRYISVIPNLYNYFVLPTFSELFIQQGCHTSSQSCQIYSFSGILISMVTFLDGPQHTRWLFGVVLALSGGHIQVGQKFVVK